MNTAAVASLSSSPLPSDPVEFCMAALLPLMTYNPRHDPVTIEDVVQHHVPIYFSKSYRHQTNCHELNLEAHDSDTKGATLDKARLRLVKSDIDQAERQSMQRACICLHYEWILSVPDKEEAVRLRGTGIFNIMEGKLINGTIVVDLKEMNSAGPDIACIVS
ncbi:MAG: hypothetical protein CYPHOPRED_005397 [Cyphobasidiales sp. Tagirdzhanova-0007]|nr:MAG: hypothetical protein CYPHOPRED_005397 [Cyphobasidiales sp. Tagirdzhanova-0007]